MKYVLTALLVMSSSASFAATALSSKNCAKDAIERADKLLRFHGDYTATEDIPNHVLPSLTDVTPLAREKIPGTRHSLQVLKVETGIYKASYTAVLKFAEMTDTNNPTGVACILMAEAITENSNPY